LPGREGRFVEPPFTAMHPLVHSLAASLESRLTLPFAFFGHSMGALVGFELARELRRRRGLEPVHLFVSGCRAPRIPNPHPPIHVLPEDRFLEELQGQYGPASAMLFENAALRALMMPTIRADITLSETYVYSDDEPFHCPISAFGGLHDAAVLYHDLRAWSAHTDGPMNMRMLPGDHFFIKSSRRELLRALSDDLASQLAQLAGNQKP
jgi:medium-chain acyl-[acyl-carrier-protein] hydrolase